MKEQFLKLIDRHNATVAKLGTLDIPVPEGKTFRAMELWHKLSCEGAEITSMARAAGIDAKCNMQSGEITVYSGEVKTDAQGICPVCGGKLEYTGERVPTCGGICLPWECQSCGATGEEGHNLVFDGQHYNVQDKDGNPVKGGAANA